MFNPFNLGPYNAQELKYEFHSIKYEPLSPTVTIKGVTDYIRIGTLSYLYNGEGGNAPVFVRLEETNTILPEYILSIAAVPLDKRLATVVEKHLDYTDFEEYIETGCIVLQNATDILNEAIIPKTIEELTKAFSLKLQLTL